MTIAEKLVKDLGEKIKEKGRPIGKTLIKLGVNPSIYYRVQNGNGKNIRKKTLSNLEEAIKKVGRIKLAQESTKNKVPGINKTEPKTRCKPKSVSEALGQVIRFEKWNIELLEKAREDLERTKEDLIGNKTGRNKKE